MLIPDKVHAGRESVHRGLLGTDVINPNFGVGHTTAEAGLSVRLVLDLAVAPRRTCSVDHNKHLSCAAEGEGTQQSTDVCSTHQLLAADRCDKKLLATPQKLKQSNS